MTYYLGILVLSVLVENFVLAQFLGICPFLGVSKKFNTAVGMSLAVIFVMVLATAVTYPIYQWILLPNNMAYLQTIVFILVIAALVQLVEITLKKYMPSLYNALGIYLPLITTNCAVLGVVLLESTLRELGFAQVSSSDILLFSGAVAFALTALLGALFSRMFTQPITAVQRFAGRLASGEYDARMQNARRDEIGELTRSMDILAERLDDARQRAGRAPPRAAECVFRDDFARTQNARHGHPRFAGSAARRRCFRRG